MLFRSVATLMTRQLSQGFQTPNKWLNSFRKLKESIKGRSWIQYRVSLDFKSSYALTLSELILPKVIGVIPGKP